MRARCYTFGRYFPRFALHALPMKLYGSLTSPFTRKARIVLAEKRIECTLEQVDLSAPDSPVTAHNPLGKIPVLVLDDGTTIYDSRVIVEFLDNVSPISRLIPEENRNRIAVRRWEALSDGVVEAGILVRYEQARDAKMKSKPWIERQMGKVERGLAALSAELGDKPWCHGNGLTLADVALACCLGWVSFRFEKLAWRETYPNLARHFDKLSAMPAFADTAPK